MSGPGRLLQLGLICWAVGVLSIEALASAGMALTALGLLLDGWSRRAEVSAGPSVLQVAKIFAPIFALVGWAVLGPLLGGGLPTGTGVARWLDFVGVPLVAVTLSRHPGLLRSLIVAIAVTFGASSVIAGCQHFGLWPSPERFAGLEWTRFPFQRVYELVPGTTDRFMAGGLLSHRLKFAHTGGLAVLALAGAALATKGRVRVWLAGLAGVGVLAVLIFPFARAAAASLVVGLFVFAAVLAWQSPRRGLVLVGAAVALFGVVGAVMLYAPLRERFLSARTSQGSGDRSFLVEAGVNAFRAHPVFGVGAGRFRVRDWASREAPQHVVENSGKAHNQLLSLAAEGGALLPVLFLFALGHLAWRGRGRGLQAATLFGGIAFFLALSAVHDPLYQAQVSMGFALLLGATSASRTG